MTLPDGFKYIYRTCYTDGCSCHPDTYDLEFEADTLIDLAHKIAVAEVEHGPRVLFGQGDGDETYARRPITANENSVLDNLLAIERPIAVAAQNLRLAKEKLEGEQESRRRSAGFKREALNRIRKDLTPEALARREAEIEELMK